MHCCNELSPQGRKPQEKWGGNTRRITEGPHNSFAIGCLGDRTPNPQNLVGVDQTTSHSVNKKCNSVKVTYIVNKQTEQ
jgi:hypothetical protein